MPGATRSLIVLISALIALPLAAATFVREPRVGRLNDRDLSLSFSTATLARPIVELCNDTSDECRTIEGPNAASTSHVFVLDRLTSGAFHRYRVIADGELMAEGRVRAPLAKGEEHFNFGVIGDTSSRWIPAKIASNLVPAGVDLVLHTGDVVYPKGEDALYDAELFRPMAPLLREVAMLPTIGNHDAVTLRAAPLLANFVVPSNGVTPESRFYSVRHGNALFVCVDVETSSFGAGSVQYRWLERTLAENKAQWRFVWLHEPPYSSHRSNPLIRLILAPLFEKYGVDIVFSGHAHLYERTREMHDFHSGGRGVIYVTEGGGGAESSSVQREPFSAKIVARSGHTIVSIEGKRLLLRRFGLDNVVVDELVISKGVAGRLRGVRLN